MINVTRTSIRFLPSWFIESGFLLRLPGDPIFNHQFVQTCFGLVIYARCHFMPNLLNEMPMPTHDFFFNLSYRLNFHCFPDRLLAFSASTVAEMFFLSLRQFVIKAVKT